MTKAKLLNVRKHVEHINHSIEDMLKRSGKHVNGLVLAPIDIDNLREIKFIGECILRKYAHSRKDILR
jgi:hypothetical protein